MSKVQTTPGHHRERARPALTLIVLAAVLLCGGCDLATVLSPQVQAIPEQIGDGWEARPMRSVGLDPLQVAELVEEIEEGQYGKVHSCLIVKNGALVLEEYFNGYDRDLVHRMYSMTKSVTSALVGIAIGDGLIDGVDEKVIQFFPEYVDDDWDARKDQITLKHLLMMSAGLQYDEHTYPYGDHRNSHAQMSASDDWMEWVLTQPMVAEPGTEFAYSTGNSFLFSRILCEATGVPATVFAEQRLFGPLGIEDYYWAEHDGWPSTGGSSGGLYLRPRDLAKFGQMYLDGGKWKGKQIVPEDWVVESLAPRIDAWWDGQYGYQWWLFDSQVGDQIISWFAARGYGDQLIAVFPSLDLVVVFTSGNESDEVFFDEAALSVAQAAL